MSQKNGTSNLHRSFDKESRHAWFMLGFFFSFLLAEKNRSKKLSGLFLNLKLVIWGLPACSVFARQRRHFDSVYGEMCVNTKN